MISKQNIAINSNEQACAKPASLLAAASGLPMADIKRAMKKGAVWLTRQGTHKRVRRAAFKLKLGDELALYYNDAVLAQEVDDCLLLKDEGDYSVWYKPTGVLSQGSLWGDHTTINRFVEQYFESPRPAFIVSRLDRAASGLMLIAHGKKTAATLSKLFEQKQIRKIYSAVVAGDASALDAYVVDIPVDGKASRSIISCVQHKNGRSLVSVNIETGRKHQIRQHLASLGFPIVGDRLYGNDDSQDLQLRCAELCFKMVSPDDSGVVQPVKTYGLPKELVLSL